MGVARSRHVLIRNKRGLHARASAKFVTVASRFNAEVQVEKDGSSVLGTSIMGLMMLAAAPGDSILISAKGPEADAALQALADLVDAKFGEE
jgi:phosphocarrier protein HPr